MASDRLCRAALFALLFSGLCHGAGIIPVDRLRGTPGQSVTFATSLTPTSEPFLALTWSFNTTTSVITSTNVDVVGEGYEGRITLDKTTGSLVLGNLTEEDSGEYELLVITHAGQPIVGQVILEVLTPIFGLLKLACLGGAVMAHANEQRSIRYRWANGVVSIPAMACPTENLLEGQSSLNLTCDAVGVVTNRAWKIKGKPLLPGGRFVFYDGGRVLSISPVHRQDTGVFLCNVSNAVSFATAKCKLKVFYGPDEPFIDQDPVGAELEDSVTLLCSADSLPKAKFSWNFKHTVMSGPEHYIEEMQKRDLGKYTCTARNEITGLEVSAVHTLQDSCASVRMSVVVCAVLTSLGLMLS